MEHQRRPPQTLSRPAPRRAAIALGALGLAFPSCRTAPDDELAREVARVLADPTSAAEARLRGRLATLLAEGEPAPGLRAAYAFHAWPKDPAAARRALDAERAAYPGATPFLDALEAALPAR